MNGKTFLMLHVVYGAITWTAGLAPGLLPRTASAAGQADRPYVKNARAERPEPIVAIDDVCAWPNLTVLRDGPIVATIFNRPSHGLMAGDVECWASQDGGSTWTKRGTPAAREDEDSNRMNVAAGLANNGDLLVISSGWTGRDASGQLGKAFRERILPAWICRSADGGRIWTVDKDGFPNLPSGEPGVPFGDILAGQDGLLRVAVYRTPRTYVFRSRDDGTTWGEPVVLDEQAATNETALFHLGGGQWLAAARYDGLDLYDSDDDAQIWTRRKKLTGRQQHPGDLTRLSDGRLLLTYGNRVEPRGVDVRFSADEGRAWSDPLRVVEFEGDGGYPSSVQLADGRVLTAYYARGIAGHNRYHMGVVVWDPTESHRPSAAAGQDQVRSAADEARLKAVVAFADNVLEKGRDRYGDKPTPLLVDGLNVDTLEPVRWVDKGQQWIPSNLASQQNLFRTLVGLSNLTGDPRYQQAAKDAIAYHFEHLRSPCGLLRWGGHRFIDLGSGGVVGEQNSHELKFNLPFYELMWELDPAATEQFLKAFWNAHVLDWGILDMNRHGSYGKKMGALWENSFENPQPFFEADGLTFLNCGSDLIYAGALLYKFTGDRGALRWSKRLAEQYVKARHPETGLGVYQYSKPRRRQQPPAAGPLPTTSGYGDRAENQFGAEFGDVAREGYLLRSPEAIYGNNAIVQLQLAELLGEEGAELLAWTRVGLLACARHVYDPETNAVRPMWADGTDLTDYVIRRDGYYGKAGTVFRAQPASTLLFWSYALGARLSGDEVLWETARSIARGHGLGDLGSSPGEDVRVDLDTDNADAVALFGVLEVCRIADAPAYRNLARRIGDNMIRQRFHQGFFVPSASHVNANFNSLEPLAILSLEAMLRGKPQAVPRYNGGRGYIHGPHDGLGRTTDATAIWSQTRSRVAPASPVD